MPSRKCVKKRSRPGQPRKSSRPLCKRSNKRSSKKSSSKRSGGKRKLPKALKPWMDHLESVRAKNPHLSLKEAMQKASKTYKK